MTAALVITARRGGDLSAATGRRSDHLSQHSGKVHRDARAAARPSLHMSLTESLTDTLLALFTPKQ